MKLFVKFTFALAMAAGLSACASASSSDDADGALVAAENLPDNHATAIFAMGCFWCAESDFEKVEGVVDVVSGYTGGTTENPTYEAVTYANTGHYEAVLVTYDTNVLNYSDLLSVFWRNVDPFDARGQFCDKGSSYLAAIFPESAEEIELAEASKTRWTEEFGQELTTAIVDRSEFYLAEDYHQDYYIKNPIRYSYYRTACRRDARLEAVWGGVEE